MPAMTTMALFPRANYPKVTVATPAAWIYTAVSECRAKIGVCSSNGGSGRHTVKCCHESSRHHISIARFQSIGLSGCQCSSECTCRCPEWLFDVKLYGLSVRCRISPQCKRERAPFRRGPEEAPFASYLRATKAARSCALIATGFAAKARRHV